MIIRIYIAVLLSTLCLQLKAVNNISPVAEEQFPDIPSISRLKEVTMPSASLATGAVEFEVPLYTLNAEDFSLPLSLRYRSNGIKSGDDSYPVGLGWALNQGFRIIRKIRGRADEKYPFFNGNITNPTYEELLSSVARYTTYSEQNITHTINKIDSEHDIFQVFLPETMLTLMYVDGQFKGVDCNEYKISSDSILSNISVINPLGYVYIFKNIGQQIEIDYKRYNIEWLLSRIELPSGNTVEFTWELSMHPNSNIQHYYNHFIYGYWDYDTSTDNNGTVLVRDYESFLHKNLTSIKYLGTEIVFKHNNDNTIEDISVYYNTIKKYSIGFSYNYIQSNSDCKLALLSEVKYSTDEKYSFEYYPDYSSDEFDRWGYCNGVEKTKYNLPAVEFKTALTNRKYYRTEGRDFDISETHMMSNLLREVRYPTGGRVVWDYEVHKFEPIEENAEISSYIGYDRLEKGGGLRVRSISLYKSDTDNQPRVRKYAYSTGKCIAAPLRSTFLSSYINEISYAFSERQQEYIYLLRKNVVEIKNTSDYLEYQDGAFPIWYEEVTEYENAGKTVYKFKNYTPPNRITRKFGRTLPDSIFSIFSFGPQLIEKSIYTNIGDDGIQRDSSTIIYSFQEPYYRKESSEYYEYDIVSLAPITNLAIKRNLIQTQMTKYAPDFCLSDIFHFDLNYKDLAYRLPTVNIALVPSGIAYEYIVDKKLVYDYSDYAIVPMQERLKSKRIVDYAKGELETVEEYSYVSGTGLIERITTSRDGECGTLELGYVPMGETGRTMRERNMVGIVTSSTADFDGCTSKAEFIMGAWSGNIVKPKSLILSRGSTSYVAQSYLYDSYGNIREIMRPDGFCTSYLWGYNGLYPVYKFSGMSFEDVKQIYGSRIEGAEVQNLHLDLSLADCPTEYAEYSPLVGISARTDASGVTTRYDYNTAGRLAQVSIDGHGTVATYDYNIGGEKPNYAAENIWLDRNGSTQNRYVETFDGLGRSISRVNSYPQGLLAEYTVYDAMGRPVKAWLPTPVDSEHPLLSDIEASSSEAYSDSNPYSVSTYESSPGGRLLSTMRPGQDWHSAEKTITYSRNVNNATLYCAPRYKATSSGIEYLGNYPGLSLLMEETKDEDGLIVQTFTDFRGLKVAEKRGGTGAMLCTRYVYDGYGDLRYVLPPKLADGSYDRRDSELQELAYWYDYDVRGNVSVRKLPGRAAIHYRYDSAGRLVAVQDGNTSPRWQLNFYDRHGRVAVEAEAAWSDSELAAFLSTPCSVSWTGSGALGGYEPERTLPRAVDAVHVVRRYDRAGRVVEETAGLSVRRQSYNRLGQLDTVRVSYGGRGVVYSYSYDYRGNLTTEKIVPEGFSAPALMTTRFYDISGRPTTTLVRRSFTGIFEDFILSDSPNDTLAGLRREYDRAGRLVRCRRGVRGNTYYSYGTPGHLAAIRNEILLAPIEFKPDYPLKPFRNSHISAFDSISQFPDPFEVGPLRSGGTYIFGDTLLRSDGKLPLYNGRISSRKTRNGRYDYTYDSFGRLTEAAFSGKGDADYSTEYTYDANANLRSIVRAGVVDRAGTGKIYGALDVLNVSLEGNRAVRYDIESDGDVFEGRTGFGVMNDSYDIEYDSNGNVVFDGSVLCAYVYNRLNQPILIEAEDGVMTLDYDGSGTLLSRRSEVDGVVTVTEYLGPYELVDGEFKAAYFDGGYFDADGKVHYYVPDYQGNIIADVTAGGEIVQTASYYPYGEPWLEPEGDNRRLYSGKERLNFGSVRHSDFGARLLDTRSGIWTTQDPCAEDFYPYSPYSVCFGDPINYRDPSGCRPTNREAWLMAKAAYPDEFESVIKELNKRGWFVAQAPTINISIDTNSGFHSILFERIIEEGKKEYVYSFMGSNSAGDWGENIAQFEGESKHYELAVNIADALDKFADKSELTFVGHSKGGGESAAASLATGRAAITFNPAALSGATISKLGLKNGLRSMITNFILVGIKINENIRIGGDPVYNLQKNLLNYRPVGHNVFLQTSSFLPHGINSFSKFFQ